NAAKIKRDPLERLKQVSGQPAGGGGPGGGGGGISGYDPSKRNLGPGSMPGGGGSGGGGGGGAFESDKKPQEVKFVNKNELKKDVRPRRQADPEPQRHRGVAAARPGESGLRVRRYHAPQRPG